MGIGSKSLREGFDIGSASVPITEDDSEIPRGRAHRLVRIVEAVAASAWSNRPPPPPRKTARSSVPEFERQWGGAYDAADDDDDDEKALGKAA